MNDETIPHGDVSTPDTDESIASAAFGNDGSASAAEPVQDESGDTQAGADEGSDGSVSTVADLIRDLGTDEDGFYGLTAKVKIDGEESDVPLRDILKAYQLEGHVNKKSIELSEARKAFETESAKSRQEWQERIGFAARSADAQEAQLMQQFQSVNWQALAQQDPAQYSALYLQFQQAGQQIAAQKQALQQHYAQTVTQYRDALRPQALAAIQKANPELADPASYGNALGEIKSYLKGIGAPDSSMESVEMDPIVFQVARDAARYRAIASKQPQIAQKLKAAPKFEKPSAKDSVPAKQAAMNSLRKRADAGDESALAELLFRS